MRIAVISVAFLAGGCRFWYKPVPVANAIGEEQMVFDGDTVNVYRSERFEVYGPSSDAVYDGYEQVNRAYRAFERYFGAPPPRLAVVLSNDTSFTLDSATLRGLQQRGLKVLDYVRPRSARIRPRYGGLDYGGVQWPVAPTAARAMLASFAGTTLGEAGGGTPRTDESLLERFPLWYRAAVIHLVGEGSPDNDLEFVREKRNALLPFGHLLTAIRTPAADSLLDPSRRGEADEQTRVIAAQASTFAHYLALREGPSILGRIGRGYLKGRSLGEMIAEFRVAPRTIKELEERWKVWIETNEA